MTKAEEIFEELYLAYRASSPDIIVEMWHDEKHTAVRVTVRLLQYPAAEALGFSSAWDAERGRTLAVRRALAEIAERLGQEEETT